MTGQKRRLGYFRGPVLRTGGDVKCFINHNTLINKRRVMKRFVGEHVGWKGGDENVTMPTMLGHTGEIQLFFD
jgi:hypothetical protein